MKKHCHPLNVTFYIIAEYSNNDNKRNDITKT